MKKLYGAAATANAPIISVSHSVKALRRNYPAEKVFRVVPHVDGKYKTVGKALKA